MDNKAYVQTLGIDEEAQQRCLQAMSQYGANHWWEPVTDIRVYAYYALREEYTLRIETTADRTRAVELLVGRPVYLWELTRGTWFDRLLFETEKAYKRIQANG